MFFSLLRGTPGLMRAARKSFFMVFLLGIMRACVRAWGQVSVRACAHACAHGCACLRVCAIACTSPSHALLRAQIPGLSLVLVTEVHDFPADEYGQDFLHVTA